MLPVPSEADDAQLMGRIARGDALAMQVLYARYNLRIYRFLPAPPRTTTAAEDILSDVFLDVWKQAARFEARSSVATWLCAMARNKAYAAHRRAEVDEDSTERRTRRSSSPTMPIRPRLPSKSPTRAARSRSVSLGFRRSTARSSTSSYYHEMSVADVSRVLDVPGKHGQDAQCCTRPQEAFRAPPLSRRRPGLAMKPIDPRDPRRDRGVVALVRERHPHHGRGRKGAPGGGRKPAPRPEPAIGGRGAAGSRRRKRGTSWPCPGGSRASRCREVRADARARSFALQGATGGASLAWWRQGPSPATLCAGHRRRRGSHHRPARRHRRLHPHRGRAPRTRLLHRRAAGQ